jgi:hypothetical protein
MQSVNDNVVGDILSAFYDNLVDSSGTLDCTRTAVAFHKVTRKKGSIGTGDCVCSHRSLV